MTVSYLSHRIPKCTTKGICQIKCNNKILHGADTEGTKCNPLVFTLR